MNQKNLSGAHIAHARKQCKPPLTQAALSDRVIRLGVRLDRAAIAKIENGLRGVQDFELLAIAKALDAFPLTLLGMSPKKSEKRKRSGK
jgi:transcriptional regulator with XRE-family HTH domain